jgi:hypothetical protein
VPQWRCLIRDAFQKHPLDGGGNHLVLHDRREASVSKTDLRSDPSGCSTFGTSELKRLLSDGDKALDCGVIFPLTFRIDVSSEAIWASARFMSVILAAISDPDMSRTARVTTSTVFV